MKKAIFILLLCCPLLAKDVPKEYGLTVHILQSTYRTFRHSTSNSSQTDCSINGHDISCNTQDTSFAGIQGVSYLMLATASDGHTYMFGCDAHYRWSKCDGLMVGTFSARIDKGRLAIRVMSGKKEREIKFNIFQVAVTQQ